MMKTTNHARKINTLHTSRQVDNYRQFFYFDKIKRQREEMSEEKAATTELEELRRYLDRLREHQFPLDRTYDVPAQLISEKRPERIEAMQPCSQTSRP